MNSGCFPRGSTEAVRQDRRHLRHERNVGAFAGAKHVDPAFLVAYADDTIWPPLGGNRFLYKLAGKEVVVVRLDDVDFDPK